MDQDKIPTMEETRKTIHIVKDTSTKTSSGTMKRSHQSDTWRNSLICGEPMTKKRARVSYREESDSEKRTKSSTKNSTNWSMMTAILTQRKILSMDQLTGQIKTFNEREFEVLSQAMMNPKAHLNLQTFMWLQQRRKYPLTYHERIVKLLRKVPQVDPNIIHQFNEWLLTIKYPVKDVIKTMCGLNKSKINCVYMCGSSNAGKTLLMTILSSVYEDYEIGRLQPRGFESTFWMEQLIDKELYLCDEIFAVPVTIDSLKMLFEGNSNLMTDIKYQGARHIPKKPVICACNNEITSLIPNAYDAIANRCVNIKMYSPCDLEIPRENKVHRALLAHLCINSGVFDE